LSLISLPTAPRPTLFPYTTLFRSARPDEIGDVDGDRIDRAVGDEQDLQSVREAVLGDAFDRGDPRNAFRQRPLGRPGSLSRSGGDRKSTRLNSSHEWISYAVFCLK